MNKDLVDKLILRDCLHHEHPLLPQLRQHDWDLHELVVLQAADHKFSEDDHSSAAHPCTTVHHHRGVKTLGRVQHRVGVPPN